MPRVLIVRGHLVTPWELRPWMDLPDRFEVSYLHTASNRYGTSMLDLREVPVGALRDRFPKNVLGEVATGVLRDRYTAGADAAYADADIVHAEELHFWFAADAARRARRHRFKLVQTIWETLPFLETYRSKGAAKFRREVLSGTDLFLPATERARIALLLEGVPDSKIMVCQPGIDVDRFAARPSGDLPNEHTLVSVGRLEWQKGHHDVLRALALLHRGIIVGSDGTRLPPRLRIIGSGPEQRRLHEYARELGLGAVVEFSAVPYEEMPAVFASASALVLGSQSSASGAFHPFDVPRVFWEEQFGMVFAEAMAAGLDIVTTSNGAIPEVLDGCGTMVPAGDYVGMARALADGPLSRPPGARVEYPAELVRRYAAGAAAERLAVAYDRVLATGTSTRR